MSLADITKRLRAAENACSRPAFSTNLIAVSKLQPDDRVIPVLDQGHRLFGENRVQEAAGKWPSWREKYPGVNVHLLGPLQTNKARQAFGLFDAIHSLDRAKLANALARLAQEAGGKAPFPPLAHQRPASTIAMSAFFAPLKPVFQGH